MNNAIVVRKENSLTRPRGGSLELYLAEISRIPLLTREQESELATRWFEQREPEAGKILVMSNLRFVVKVAREYLRYGVKLSDLIQEGNLGLMHAVDKFDPRKGYRLISYAVWWIRAYLQAFILRSFSLVRMGTTRIQRRILSGLAKARRMIASLDGDHNPNAKKLAKVLEVGEQDIVEAVSRMKMRDISLDQPMNKDSDLSLGEVLPDDEENAEEKVVSADLQNRVRKSVDGVYEQLTPRERYLLNHRLMAESPITLEAAGHEFGVSRERVRQLEERLKTKLRQVMAPALGELVPAAA